VPDALGNPGWLIDDREDSLVSAVQYEDRTLICRDCSLPFTFSAGEQEFFASKKLENEPRRCANCRVKSRIERKGDDPEQRCTELPCHDCGVIARVPFRPNRDKPVYCAECFQKNKKK